MNHYYRAGRAATCLAAALLLPLTFLRAQTPQYTPAQLDRLAKLSELYGHVRFFHPYLGYRRINWDSAYAATAPQVAQAATDAEAATALRRLLAVLGDPATTVQLACPQAPVLPADSLRVYWQPDSTLVLQTNALAGADDYGVTLRQIGRLARRLPRARALLLDLRSPRPLTAGQVASLSYALFYTRLNRYLTAQPVPTPAMRLRGHSGFAAEDGGTSGGYYAYFYTKSGELVQPYKVGRNLPTAVLLNENSSLPAALYALRGRPQARFFAAGPVSDAALAKTAVLAFSDQLKVEFRTGELVNADGSLGLAGIEQLPATVRPEAAAAYALAQLRQPAPALPAPRPVPAPLAPAAPSYPTGPYPALGYRLLAAAKIHSTIHYFHAYRDLIPGGWHAALRPALAELAAAPDAQAYALAVAHYYRHLQDGHGAVRSATLRRHVGDGGSPLEIQFIENQPVIVHLYGDSLHAKGLRVGDVLTAVNGEPVAARTARLAAILSASNEWTRLSYVAARLVRAPVGQPLRLELRGADNRPKTVTLRAQSTSRLEPGPDTTRVYRILPGNIGYADLGRLESEDTDRMFTALLHTKTIIFDVRGYPNGTAWTIAPRLTGRQQPAAASFFRYAPTTPSLPDGDEVLTTEKRFFSQTIPANPGKPVYQGKTVMLVDERTQSQAEHTGLFFEAANGTEFIGSPTAGANGDVTSFSIPGDITLSFSGHDVRHADGRQLQQVGLQPKVLVRPTLKGVQAGQDEVLARAVRYVQTGR